MTMKKQVSRTNSEERIPEEGNSYSSMMRPLFPKAEFEFRHSRVRKAMTDAKLDAVIAFAPVNIFWSSGFLGSPSHRKTPEFIHGASYPWVVISHDETALVGNSAAVPSYEHETTIKRIFSSHPVANRMSALVEALKSSHALGNDKKIGIDMGDYESISVPQFQTLQSNLKDNQLVDATDLFQSLRIVRTAREIECLRIAGEIQNRAFAKFFSRVAKRMNEVELTALMEQCQFECGSTESGNALVWTHPSYALFRRQYPDRLMKDGDVQWIDGGAVYNGYHADYDQLLVYGEANSKQKHTFEAMKKTYEEGISQFKVGQKFSDIAKSIMPIMKRNGLSNPLDPELFLGHNLGYLMVEPPYFGTFSPPWLTLQPGMVIAPEWFTLTEYGPILYERNFVVRNDGSLEEMSQFEKELIEITNR
jgi:Xaa-Pro aminopeptidase